MFRLFVLVINYIHMFLLHFRLNICSGHSVGGVVLLQKFTVVSTCDTEVAALSR